MPRPVGGRPRIYNAPPAKAAKPAPAPSVPLSLTEQELLAEAEAFLSTRGPALTGSDSKRAEAAKERLAKDSNLRWDFLRAEGMTERGAPKRGLEIFSNALQRSRWIHTSQKGRGKTINGAEVARDAGMLFAGTQSMLDGPMQRRNNRWNLNYPQPLPISGFRPDRLNDDGDPTLEQTHHLAYYAMVAGIHDHVFGSLMALAGGYLHDVGHPNDQRLSRDGIKLGRRLDDPNFDLNDWIWKTIGDVAIPGRR
jgi:hypothetical protein